MREKTTLNPNYPGEELSLRKPYPKAGPTSHNQATKTKSIVKRVYRKHGRTQAEGCSEILKKTAYQTNPEEPETHRNQ